MKPKEVENLVRIVVTTKCSLYFDILKLFINTNNKIEGNYSKNDKLYKTGIYVIKLPNQESYKYFEIKYIKYANADVSSKPFVLLLFKDIENEKYVI